MLGVAWSVFQPLSMILVYTVIFSNVMKSKLAGMESAPYAYSIYLCAGLMLNGVNVFLNNGNLLKKVSFPRICLPTITACTAVLNFLIGFLLFCFFLLLVGKFPWQSFVLFFPLLTIQLLLSLAIGLGLSVMNVFFRDVAQMLGIMLQFWFWFTPIVYPVAIIPDRFRWLLEFNPMYGIMKGYQSIFVYNVMPEWHLLWSSILCIVVFGIWSWYIYHRHANDMVDEL